MPNAATVAYTVPVFTTSTPTTVTEVNPSSILLTPNGNAISNPAGTYNLIVSGTTTVNIQFSVKDESNTVCAVVGVVIDPDNPLPDPFGRNAFPSALINANGLLLSDRDPSQSSYEFMLLLQNPSGNLALLDPRISNSG